jgi:hypothetical protein
LIPGPSSPQRVAVPTELSRPTHVRCCTCESSKQNSCGNALYNYFQNLKCYV